MAYRKGIGRLSGNPTTDSFTLPSIPASASFVQPMLLNTSVPGEPEAGYHVTITDPIFWGTITINGVIYNFPSTSGVVGDVLTLSASDTASWEPAVHRISFGTTGLTPSSLSSNDVTVGGVLNVANGGTGLSTIGVSGTALISNGATLSYGYPDQAENLSGGSLWTIPYQTTTNVTAFVPAGITGQVLSATTGAAPSWGPGDITIGTTPIQLGSTVTALAGVTAVTLTQDPPSALDAATKQYVDSRTGSLNNLGSVVAATTTNVPLSGLAPIDGVAIVAGDSVLVKNQTLPAQDGLYIAAAGGWSYAGYANTWADYVGALVFVAGGSQSGSSWTQTTGPGGTLGVTAQSWAQIGAAISYTGGPGINITGGTISNTGVLSWSGGTTGLTPSLAATGAITLAGTLQIANGGTGLTALGTGVQAAFVNNVNAANGFAVLNGSGVLAIAQGGTGASTANAALNALLPTQTGNVGKYLQTDGSNAIWSANPLGTVTSVDVSGGTTGLTTSGGPVTTSGVITLAGTLAITNGGTGLTTIGANGTVLTSDGTNASWAALPPGMVYPASGIAVSTGAAWGTSITPGTGVATALGVNIGTAGSFVVNGGALGTPASGNLSTGAFTWPTFNQSTTGTAANVTGVVAIANGGTGQTTATTALNALLPSQVGQNNKYLVSDGTNTSWSASGALIGYTNSATPFNTALGANAGDSLTSCTDSVFIGYNAGTSVTTAVNVIAIGSGALDGATGPTNAIAIGKDALGSATTGAINNIAIGASCMSSGLSGSNNIAIGVGAGQPITNGTQNTLIGGAAGGQMTSGIDNVAVGYQSLDACNTGSQNVALGKGSLGALTNGASNVAVGFNALAVTTTASNNVAVGTSAGTNVSSGTFNAIFGNSAALALTAGGNNAIFGYQAADALTTNGNTSAFGSNALGSATGGNNAGFGYNSGSSITTGTNNTILGSYVGTAALTGACVLSDGAGNIRLFTNSSGALSFNGSSFGTTGQVLVSNGSAAVPTWQNIGSVTTGYWGGVYDTTATQTAALANTAYAVALGLIDADSFGVSLNAGTQIVVANAGVYTFAPSLQIRNSDSNIHELNMWFRRNGVDVANSNSRFSITASHGGTDGFSVPAVVFTAKLNAADYIELMWSVSNTAVSIYTIPATAPAPAAPGAIVSVAAV